MCYVCVCAYIYIYTYMCLPICLPIGDGLHALRRHPGLLRPGPDQGHAGREGVARVI